MIKAPKIDSRNQKDLIELTKNLIVHYCPEWAGQTEIKAGQADDTLVQIFARMTDIVIQRLNRVPDKNFLAFLDLMGIRLSPPRVARTSLVFTMAKGATQYGFVPAGTQVAGKAPDKTEVVFETDQDLTIIPAKLVKAVSIEPGADRYRDHSPVWFEGVPGQAEVLFTGSELLPHRLFLGHDTLFGFKEESTLTIEITLKQKALQAGDWEVQWYGYADDLSKPAPLTPVAGQDKEVIRLLKSGSISFEKVNGLAEQTLTGFEKAGGIEKSWKSFWIYAEATKPIPREALPEIDRMRASVAVKPAASVASDLAFYNNLPIDLTKDFCPFGEKPKFNDTFYLGSKEVFAKEGAIVTLKVTLSDENVPNTTGIKLIWEFCDGKKWLTIGETSQQGVSATVPPAAFRDTTNAFMKSGEVVFKCPAVGVYPLNGEENYWIRVRIIGGNYGEEAKYQEQTVNGKYKVVVFDGVKKKIVPVVALTVNGKYQVVAVNGIKKKIVKDPATGRETAVDLGVNAADGTPEKTEKTAPATAAIDLDVDKDGLVEKTEWIYIPATYQWPSVKSLSLKYELETVAENLKIVLTYNDFLYQDQSLKNNTAGLSFAPFEPVSDKQPAVYLGFDRDIGALPVNLFFPLEPALFSAAQVPHGQAAPIAAWEYWNNKTWSILSVEDRTMNLTKQEMIRFMAPDDLSSGLKFGQKYFWIRARLEAGTYADAPKLKSLYGNAVWAHNRITLRDEILGSSNGKPDQSFSFAHAPVLSGQEVCVRETALTEEERKVILAEEGKEAVAETRDAAENVTEILVRWHEVVHFHFSGPGSRHYILDRNKGEITFGDGVRGLIPPAGKDNIRCRQYQYGGGEKGNVAARALAKLRTTFPYIDSVANPVAAEGGFDMEDLDHVRVRGPQTIKNRQRAVTYEDFEWLAREASPKVAKVKCLPTTDTALKYKPGRITLIVVPESAEAKPLPSRELLNEIEEYLFARTSTYLTAYPSQINLLGPGYIKIGSEVSVAFTSMNQAKIVEGRILDSLHTFFHPLQGGAEGQGWDFGRPVPISEVYELIEKIEGVDYVTDLVLKPAVQIYTLQLHTLLQLPYKLPAGAAIRSTDDQICFVAAETVPVNTAFKTLRAIGFKEGDVVALTHGKESLQLAVRSVSGDLLECAPLAAQTSEVVYPRGSNLATTDSRVRSYILNDVSSLSPVVFLKTAVFESKDKGRIHYQDKTASIELEGCSDRVETVFIDDHSLVYSGAHFVNRTAQEEPVFPYLYNSSTKELHDLKNENPNCKIDKTLRAHRLFVRDLNDVSFQKRKFDYCRWCFGKEMSKEKLKG
ncbi:MAG: putative baseplate assembly protein [Desulfobacteraceae bacterium]|nr:MAG: putative baseplate assembly protein [Desulfobacteraceae bacterium]